MGGSPKKSDVRPSYEDGRIRTAEVAKMQDEAFSVGKLRQLMKKVVIKRPRKGTDT